MARTPLLTVLTLLLYALPSAVAQGGGAPPQAVTASDPAIDLADLEARIVDIRTGEAPVPQLTADAQAWKALVEAKDREVAAAVAREEQASGDERDRITGERIQLLKDRNALRERLVVVIEGLREAGGPVAQLDKYVDGLSEYIDISNPGALWIWAKDWLTSDGGGIRWGLNIGAVILILVGFWILARVLGKVTGGTLRASRLRVSDLLMRFFVNTVRKVTIFVGVIIALGQIGVDIGPLLAGLGVVGFIVGFALQGTLGNFACGIMILLYRPYDIGDFINAAGVSGTVKDMTLVSTSLCTPDNQSVVIPNSSIWGNVITNVTANPTRRVDLVFGIGYSEDIDAAKQVFRGILEQSELVLKSPEPVVEVHELGDSSVNFVVRPWVKTSDFWDARWAITAEVKRRLDAEGISIPFPQRDVHLFQEAERN